MGLKSSVIKNEYDVALLPRIIGKLDFLLRLIFQGEVRERAVSTAIGMKPL